MGRYHFLGFLILVFLISCDRGNIQSVKKKEVVSQKIAREEAARFFNVSITQVTPYDVSNSFFKRFKFFEFRTITDLPPRVIILSVSNEGSIFSLFPKNEFNSIVSREKTKIDSNKRAFDYTKFYLRLRKTYFLSDFRILDNVQNIPGVKDEEIIKFQEMVKGPSIDLTSLGYHVELWIWGFGSLERHFFDISRDGKITHKEERVAQNIGDYITLE